MSGGGARQGLEAALGALLTPYGELVDDYFREEKVKAPLVWMAAQSGPPPTSRDSAPFLLWQPLYHEGGIARPTRRLGHAVPGPARHIEAHGGEGAHVGAGRRRILVTRGGARRRRAGQGRQVYTARAVLAGAHALETFGGCCPRAPAARAPGMRVGNGFGAILRSRSSEPGPVRGPPGRRRPDRAAADLPRPRADLRGVRRLPRRPAGRRSPDRRDDVQRRRRLARTARRRGPVAVGTVLPVRAQLAERRLGRDRRSRRSVDPRRVRGDTRPAPRSASSARCSSTRSGSNASSACSAATSCTSR
jgi:hypothetical protein